MPSTSSSTTTLSRRRLLIGAAVALPAVTAAPALLGAAPAHAIRRIAPKTLFAVPGTWEIRPGIAHDTPIGLLKDLTDRISPDLFDVVFVNYPARFGPIAGNGEPPLSQLGQPSYEESVTAGVDEMVRLISALPEGRRFGIVGYSQGGDVAARVGAELMGGRLAHRLPDTFWLHTIGCPRRRPGHTFHRGNGLEWGGIMGRPIGGFEAPGVPAHLDWFDYCLPNDVYGDANPDSYLAAGYEAVGDMTLVDPDRWLGSVLASLASGTLAEAREDLESNPAAAARKGGNTAYAAERHLSTNAHNRYHLDHIVPGRTALEHSASHLNFWGARR